MLLIFVIKWQISVKEMTEIGAVSSLDRNHRFIPVLVFRASGGSLEFLVFRALDSILAL